jgi:hypothetical protein
MINDIRQNKDKDMELMFHHFKPHVPLETPKVWAFGLVYLVGFSIGHTYIEEMMYLFRKGHPHQSLGLGRKCGQGRKKRREGQTCIRGLPK